MFRDFQAFQNAIHQFPVGCINDFCHQKREIILKLRTADICIDCMHLLKDNLESATIQQILSILEGVRLQTLFNQNFRQNLQPSRMQVTVHGKIFLTDYGNIAIRLRPLEKTLCLFFLKHPEGLMLHDLARHREELKIIYSLISTSGLMTEIRDRIDSLVDVTSNSASEKIAKIKTAFERSVGKDLAKPYYIQGERGNNKRIPLNRDLVSEK